MGGKGKGKGKGKDKKRKRANKGHDGAGDGDGAEVEAKRARNDIWQEDGAWDLTNEAYEAYYARQRVCSEEEWPVLLQHLRTGLPVAIRVNRMRAGARSLCTRLSEMKAACVGDAARELYAPRPLTWYPHSLAWQWLGLERRTIKKNKSNKALKEFLFARERSGLISRQEVVSMIPPLFLGVESHHLVLDLCAAPGSKTSQMIEAMHWASCAENAGPPSGLVVANELQWKRANMLAHQVQRLGSPCAAVVNMDAQYFPELWVSEDGSQQQLRYDRVLCDVPCSGDGTMRKTPYIWKSWTVKDGLSLHIRQLGILNRGLDLLKVGGRIVYSTCSLNPMEDEAVVAAALVRHEGAVALVPPPDLPGFKAARCLDNWLVPEPNGTAYFSDYESMPKEHKEGKCKLLPSMFPPTGNTEVLNAVRDHCRRMLPHLMDTGGFFVAILEKRAELKPSARTRRAQAFEAKKNQPEAAASENMPESEAAEAKLDEEIPASAPMPPQGLKKITKEYRCIDDATWRELQDFYGFDASLAKNFAMRVEGEKLDKVFLLSDGVRRFLHSETKMPTRMVLCGVVAFQAATSYHEQASRWTPLQQGILALVALGMRRRITASRVAILRLLREKELTIAELREEAARGDVRGLDALVDSQASTQGALRPGSLAVVLDAEGIATHAPFAVVATLTDSMLELVACSSDDISSLVGDLEGQPAIEDLLNNAGKDDDDDDGADADAETAMDPGADEVTDADVDSRLASGKATASEKVVVSQEKTSSTNQSDMDVGADADIETGGVDEPGEISSEAQA